MKQIKSLNDLIGLTVTMEFFDYENDFIEENPIEIKVKIKDAYIEDWYFYEKWNEPLSVIINIEPIDDADYYNEFINKKIITFEDFNDSYSLENIINIIN